MLEDFVYRHQNEYFFDALMHVEDTNYFQVKKYLGNTTLQPTQFVYLQDVVNRRFFHNGFKVALGHQVEELTSDFFINHIHPADLTMYLKLSKAYRKFVCYHKHELKPSQHSFEMNFRLRKADGSYAPVMRQITPLVINEKNEVEVFISFCTDLSFLKPSNRIQWRVNGPESDKFDQYIYDEEPENKQLFSGRELEVLQLLVKGYSSSRIANVLFVSVNTVNTHRKSLMKKANVNKTIDLISFAVENGHI